MNPARKSVTTLIFFSVFFSSCGLLGIHFKPHNPRRAGKFPKPSERLSSLGDQTSRFRTCFDVKKYELWMMPGYGKPGKLKGKMDGWLPDPGKKYIRGKVIITAVANEDIDTFQLDLDKNLEIYGDLVIDNVKTTYFRRYNAVYIIPGNSIKKNVRFTITTGFRGKPVEAQKPPWKGGLVWKEDENKNPWWGVACESEGASLWWLCKDVTNDEADTTLMHYTCDSNLVMVGNGTLVGTKTEGKMRTYDWLVTYPINTYDITFYLGNFVCQSDSFKNISGRWVPINHYVLRGHQKQAYEHFMQAKGILKAYEELFGEYPWQNDGYRLVESPYEGMEHQSAIAYGHGFKNGHYPFDYIILHETAHEWWGNAVSANDLGDMWIQEGFATFAEYLYLKHTTQKGAEPADAYLRNYWLTILNKRPIAHPYNLRYSDYKDGDMYTKGAYMLRTLEFEINNDSLFGNIIKTFYDRYKLKPGGTTTADFEKVVNELTGKDYTWFFKQYLHSRKAPILEFQVVEGVGMYYRWTACDPDFLLPVKITVDGKVHTLYPDQTIKFIADPDIRTFKTRGLFWVIRQPYFTSIYQEYFGLRKNKKLEHRYQSQKK